jgi:hypothetical protein
MMNDFLFNIAASLIAAVLFMAGIAGIGLVAHALVLADLAAEALLLAFVIVWFVFWYRVTTGNLTSYMGKTKS